jgi:hypothetical protein
MGTAHHLVRHRHGHLLSLRRTPQQTRKITGETGWSRALKIAGVIWIVFGSLGSILWLERYRMEYIPGTLGIVIGLGGFVLAWSLGALLNLVAQVSDHTHARHLMMETPAKPEK